MKTSVAILLCVLAVALAETYTDQYDNTDINPIMMNCRTRVKYAKCILGDDKNCPKEALELKKTMPDALATSCSKCTETQKSKAREIMNILKCKNEDIFNSLAEKYDPKGNYRSENKKELDNLKCTDDFSAFPKCDYKTGREVE